MNDLRSALYWDKIDRLVSEITSIYCDIISRNIVSFALSFTVSISYKGHDKGEILESWIIRNNKHKK